jgi:hypothetical protein
MIISGAVDAFGVKVDRWNWKYFLSLERTDQSDATL